MADRHRHHRQESPAHRRNRERERSREKYYQHERHDRNDRNDRTERNDRHDRHEKQERHQSDSKRNERSDPLWKKQKEERRPFFPGREPVQTSVEAPIKVNRKDSCPFCIRLFYAINQENSWGNPQKLPTQELTLHAWLDSSLRELAEIVRCHLPAIRTKQRFQFWAIKQDESGHLRREELGNVYMHRKVDRADERYLCNSRFAIGDYVDVSINYK